MSRTLNPGVAWVLAGLMLLAARGAGAAEKAFNLYDAGKKICDEIKAILPEKQAVFVREFRSVASAHVGLSKIIGDELIGAGYTIEAGAPIELEGRLHRFPKDDHEPIAGFNIHCSLAMADGSDRKFIIEVLNADQGIIAAGETGEYHAPPSKPMGTPATPPYVAPPKIDQTQVFPVSDSPYHIEILIDKTPEIADDDNFEALKPFKKGPLLMCTMPKDAIYAVKIFNDTDFEAVASVYIDGLNRYGMADDPKMRDGMDLIPKQGFRIIKGYFRDGKTVDSFQIGEYSESIAAKQLPGSPDIGLITVTFAACWEKGKDPAPNEPEKSKNVNPPGTKPGPKRNDPTATVEREVGKVRSVIKVRYELPQ